MAIPATIGRYEILERLGEGGMGAVYLGRDPRIGRLIAVKVLHAHLRDPNLHQRFLQEARSAGALTHPNIVTVHDFGDVDGAPYLVMEYVRGRQVAGVIKQREPVLLATKLEWLEGLCAGLHYAHEAKIVHRDVKPQNLMIDERGALKILDFGIARVAESGLTKMSMVIGTPGYMSPEQIESRAIDRRSDIFSAGAVSYALLSYRDAFEGDTAAAVMHRVLTAEPPLLAEICDGLPTEVAAVVARALRKAPDERYQSAVDMQRALASARRTLPVDGPEPATAFGAPPPIERRTPASRTPTDFRRRRLEQIDRHLRDGYAALKGADNAAAVVAAELALLLDPDHVEAHRLLTLANEPGTAVHVTEAIDDQELLATRPPTPLPAPMSRSEPAPVAPLADASLPSPAPSPSQMAPPPPASMREPATNTPPSATRRGLMVGVGIGTTVLAAIVAIGLWATRSGMGVPEAAPATTQGAEANPPAAPQPSEAEREAGEVARLLTDAAAAEGRSNWAEATTLYQQVLSRVPDHAEAHAGIARLDARVAPPPAPVASAPRKTDGPSAEDRVRVNGLVRRATSKYEAGDYDGAIADLNQALASVPQDEAAATLLKEVLRAKETEAKMPRRPPPGP